MGKIQKMLKESKTHLAVRLYCERVVTFGRKGKSLVRLKWVQKTSCFFHADLPSK